MNATLMGAGVGPCDSPRKIREWIDELLDMRLELADQTEIVAEIDASLRQAAGWLAARRSRRGCP